MTSCRAVDAILAGTLIRVRCTVVMRAVAVPAEIAAARAMLNVMHASATQAAFAWNRPEGRCASGPPLSSAMVCSMIAC